MEVRGAGVEAERLRLIGVRLREGFRADDYLVEDLTLHVGDRVLVELSPYDLSRGRITYRFK